MSETKLVRGRWVVTGAGASDAVLNDAAILVEDGRVASVGAWTELRQRHPDAPVVGSERVAVMPGLINAHHHSGAVSMLQQGVPDQLLETWLLATGLCRPVDPRLASLLSAARLLKSGVTSVVELHSGGGTAEAYADAARRALAGYEAAGIRVAFAPGLTTRGFLVLGDGADERFIGTLPDELRHFVEQLLPARGDVGEDDYLAIVEELWRAYRSHSRIDIWFGPPGPTFASDSFMLRIAEAARRLDTGIQTHVTESLYERLDGPRSYGKSTLRHLGDLGLLGPHFSIAHGVWLGESDIDLLAESGAALAHNPSSNLRLRAGIAPLNALLARGATVALGMDGTTINDDEDFFTEMRLALRLHRSPRVEDPVPRPSEILRLATAGGARLLRKERQLGRIAPGYAADLVLVDLERPTWPWVAPEVDIRDLLVLRAQAGDVDTVLIEGEVVLSGGRPTRFDLEAAGREAAAQLRAKPFPSERAALTAQLQRHIEAYYRDWEVPALEPYTAYNSRR